MDQPTKDQNTFLIYEEKTGDYFSHLSVIFQQEQDKNYPHREPGTMVIDGHNFTVDSDDSEYEYQYYVKKPNLNMFVAELIMECFAQGVFRMGLDLKAWMELRKIPFDSWSWGKGP